MWCTIHNISLLGPDVLTLEPGLGRAVKLYTAHEHWLICPGTCSGSSTSAPARAPVPAVYDYGQTPTQLWRYTELLERASRHVDQFVSPSRFTARMHSERGFRAPLAHLPHFLDRVDDDWQAPAPRPQEDPYFLFVGRLETVKGSIRWSDSGIRPRC